MSDLVEDLTIGGSGNIVNSLLPLHSQENRLELDDQVWLKTGVIETDVSKYPDATISSYSDTVINSAKLPGTSNGDISYKNGKLWTSEYRGSPNSLVHQLDMNGTATGLVIDTSQTTNSNGYPSGLCQITIDSVNCLIVAHRWSGGGGTLFKYNADTGQHLGQGSWGGLGGSAEHYLAADDTHIYSASKVESKVRKFNSNLDLVWEVDTPVSYPTGIEVVGDTVYVFIQGNMYGFDKDGNEIAITNNPLVPFPPHSVIGMAFINGYWHFNQLSFIQRELPVVGVETAITDSNSNLPLYVRVK